MMKAILTGHTRGLGAAIARELLLRNIPVLGIARNRNGELEKLFPHLLQQAEVNLGESVALLEWLGNGALQAFAENCKCILLINNAGIVEPVGPLDKQDAVTIAQAITLNVATPAVLSSAVATQAGVEEVRILHISSGAGRNAYSGWSIYCATKAALDHHARSVALDALKHVRICSLAPGVIDTDMQAVIRATSKEQFPMRERFEELKRSGQLVKPEDCARKVIDYLLDGQFGKQPVADLRG
jgi:NAD(P)-dependent dehydrogenase (short-subunit alcohol dehydrogenase family)